MRQTMEDGVSEVLSSVVEDIGEAVTRNISGAQILHELLSAPWLHALLKIYECLIQFQKMKPNPFLPYASGLSYEIMTLIQRAPHPSPEARELFGLLSSPHVQALLSSHDSVAQEDYLPVLPPLPDELPEDEEAMRIVCLVKNNQPLTSSEHRSLDHGRGGLHSSWNSLHCIPLEPPTSAKRAWSGEELRRTETEAKHPSHPNRSQPQGFVTHYEMSGNCVFCPQNAVLWKQRLNLSEPAVFSPNTLPGKRKTRFTCSHGATIRRDEESGEIYIARVIHGGLADRSGLLHPGDLIVEVNGNPVVGLEPAKVIRILTNSTGTILFKVIPNSTQVSSNQKPVYMRAMVDYCPRKDSSIPCPDAGMSFSRGDLLEVVDQSDAQWWQARKLPCGASFARLIPSASTLKSKQREHWWCQPLHVHTCMRPLASAASENEQTSVDDKSMTEMDNAQDIKIDEADSDFTEGIYLAGFRRSFHVWKRTSFKKRRQSCSSCSPNSNAMATPYEEVVLYQRPPQENHRLIMLVGASGVGVNELRKRLIKLNPSTFQGPVPHTTRPMREGEQMGREYHFVTKELFEYMVCNHRFVEYGESKGHLYGTSFDSIDEVLKHGRMCIVDAESHSIPILRTRKLKPFVIFIKPPSPERLRQTRKNATILTNDAVSRPFTEEDFVEMEEVSRLIETKYKQFFDSVLVNDGLQDASMKLCSIIHQAQNEPQWIPVNWILSEEQ